MKQPALYVPHLQINLSCYLKIRHQYTHNLQWTEINGNKRKKESAKDNVSSNSARQLYQRPGLQQITSERRREITSCQLRNSGPAGHQCIMHNNMERWWILRRKKGERGREGDGLQLNPLTFFAISSNAYL